MIDKNITRRNFMKCCGLGGLALGLPMSFRFGKADAAEKYRIAWSHYTGWEPYQYMADSGVMKKWAQKYGIEVEIVLFPDYAESINAYTMEQFDGCVMTNMDALINPATGGKDSEVVIIGDFSNGNDGIVLVNGNSVKDLRGRNLFIYVGTVSHYLLSRALEMNGMTERELTLKNTSDVDIESVFTADAEKNPKSAVCTWNPMLMRVRNVKNANLAFNSSQIPGEIMDCLVIHANRPDKLKKAVTGAWFETMTIMSGRDKAAKDALDIMAKSAGGTLAEFKRQLQTTAMFYKAKDAAEFARDRKLKETMEYVRTFSFDHGLYGNGAPSKDLVGIEFPDKSIMGDPKNVRLRFTDKYMQMAADDEL